MSTGTQPVSHSVPAPPPLRLPSTTMILNSTFLALIPSTPRLLLKILIPIGIPSVGDSEDTSNFSPSRPRSKLLTFKSKLLVASFESGCSVFAFSSCHSWIQPGPALRQLQRPHLSERWQLHPQRYRGRFRQLSRPAPPPLPPGRSRRQFLRHRLLLRPREHRDLIEHRRPGLCLKGFRSHRRHRFYRRP